MVSTRRLLLVAAVLLIIVLAVVLFYIAVSVSSILSVHFLPPVNGTIHGNVSLSTDDMLTYNNSQNLVDYALINYALTNATLVNASLSVYTKQPLEKVYLIDTVVGAVDYCDQCFLSSTLYPALYSTLQQHGLLLNSSSFGLVSLSNMSTIPDNSIIVLPTGRVLASLLPGNTSYAGQSLTGNTTLLSLFAKGDSVIYVGVNFSTSIGFGGTIYSTPQQTKTVLNQSGITISAFPYYSSNSTVPLNFSKPTFSFLAAQVNGNIVYLNVENGTLIALSNFPTVGWRNESSFAEDLATLIDSKVWFNRVAYGNSSYAITNSISAIGTVPVLTLNEQMQYPTSQAQLNSVDSYSGVIDIIVSNVGKTVEKQIPFHPEYLSDGDVNLQSVVGETQVIPITVSSSNTFDQQTSFHLSLMNLSGYTVQAVPIGFYQKPFTVISYDSFEVPSGYDIVELQDLESVPYTAALVEIANVTLSPVVLNFKNNTFIFNVTSNRLELNNISYSAEINGAYTESGRIENGTLNYSLPPGSVEQYGTKYFNFSMFSAVYTYQATYPPPPGPQIPPLDIEFAIAIGVVVLLNIILKAPTRDDYFIDVPNFPPTRKVGLKVSREAVTGIFTSVNYAYRWKYMPLTAEEIKNGVGSNIRYEDVPVAITLQNTTQVLNRLVSEDVLSSNSGYYAPTKWIEDSRHDMEYLTIFRKLRDYCVQNAMLFTDLDADQHMDMLITKRGTQIHIIIYSSATGMKDIALNNAYRIYVVFLSETQKLDFLARLYDSYGETAELLKMGIEYQYIMLVDTDNLDQMVF